MSVLTTTALRLQHIALLGNPNVGKSSLFNALTGLDQKVGNFPGVTVDRKTGGCSLAPNHRVEIIDLPGIYSLFAKSPDERVVLDVLLDPQHALRPDLLLVVLDASNLERSLLLYTQALDLGFGVIPVLNLLDVAQEQGVEIRLDELEKRLQTRVYAINARQEKGLAELKQALANYTASADAQATDLREKILLTQAPFLAFLSSEQQAHYQQQLDQSGKNSTDVQLEDSLQRMNRVQTLVSGVIHTPEKPRDTFTDRADRLITHPIAGYFIYLGVLFLLFQLIFSVSEYPMNWIEAGFGALSEWTKSALPEGAFADLLTDGIIAGIGGVVIFIPQIALLFAFIALLEESGYMSRVVFLMDRPMRLFGLSGKSVVPLISGAACAVPAIMSARSIEHWKERLITIFVTPFISCSARLPVYIILIALVIPDDTWAGFNLKGLTLLGLYLLGIVGALLTALVLSIFWKVKERALFVIDLPSYKAPRWKNVGIVLYQKTKTFVLEAGKVILAISILLWGLASYGPPAAMQAAETRAQEIAAATPEANYEEILAAQKLEASYIGHLGQFIEPTIRPLGYDWKIGIALLTSFAAREVFVGTLGTIYSVGEEDQEERLVDRMRRETFSDTGKPVYTLASGLSLLVFYVFAMQCMSTLAIVYRETGGWKFPLLQLAYMTAVAYLAAWLTFVFFS